MNARQTNSLSLAERARQEHDRPALHPFKVGETYENRLGKYEVMQIAPPRMTIRYEDGQVVTADITILARIWDNLQLPPEQPETGPRGRATSKPPAAPSPTRAPARFQGLTNRDFAVNPTRPAWRGHLGTRIAARLSEITGVPHRAFPVESRPQLYIGREHHFNGRSPEHRAKFLFRLTPEAAEYGFCVERDSQKMDLTWDWRRFIAALQEPDSWSRPVEAAMRERGLEAAAESSTGRVSNGGQEPGPIGRWTATAAGLACVGAEGGSEPKPCTWRDVADALIAVEPQLKVDFDLLGRTPKAEAVGALDELVEQVAQTYAALMPLYTASAR